MEPGASVGIICSQSLSQPITQFALSSFHQAGSKHELIKQGVPRVEAIVDQTIKSEESSNSFINKRPSLAQDVLGPQTNLLRGEWREEVGGNSSTRSAELRRSSDQTGAKGYPCTSFRTHGRKGLPFELIYNFLDLTVNDLIHDYFLMDYDESETWWYPIGLSSGFYFIDPLSLLRSSFVILRIRFDVVKMGKYQLSLFNLLNILNEQITGNDIHFFLSPQQEGIIDVILSSHKGENSKSLLKIWIKVISPCHIFPASHVKGIKDLFFVDDLCYTKGTNTFGLLQSKSEVIDKKTLRTDNPKDMRQALGIEAARKILVEELSKAMFGSIQYNNKHINLLADFMTSKGNISSIKSISELAKDKSVLTRASNERSIQLLKEACMNKISSKIVGVSDSIITGQTANIGTGFCAIHDTETNSDE